MRETTTQAVSRARAVSQARSACRWALAAALWLATTTGCGPAEEVPELADPVTRSQELDSANGLSANGLSANGLSANGLSANGLSANGLSTASFTTWFQTNPARSDMVMRYLVRCAVPAGQTRSYTNPQTGQSYTWSGGLGLAPFWASGAAANRDEQQLVTACLLAHVNRYGRSVPISVLGHIATGAIIPFTSGELGVFSEREACFFGNLFTQEGLYFGVDRFFGDHSMYLTRACAGMGSEGNGDPATACAPLVFIGDCSAACSNDWRGPFYWGCVRNGVSYSAVTSRMRWSDYAQLFAPGN
jgi:hypothetical protein